MVFDLPTSDQLWRIALAVVPLVIIVALLMRCFRCRPSTRHSLWLVILAVLVLAPLMPRLTWLRLPTFNTVAATSTEGDADPVAIEPRTAARPAAPRFHLQRPDPVIRESGNPLPPGSMEAPDFAAANEALFRDVHEALVTSPLTTPAFGTRPAPAFDAAPPMVETLPPSILAVRERSRPADRNDVAERTPFTPPVALAEPSVWATAAEAGRLWAMQLRDIGRRILELPPLPMAIWGGGIAILLALLGCSLHRARRLVARGVAAPASVLELVERAARELRLGAPPRTVMLHDRVTPMICCCPQPTLALPTSLWDQLDDEGRQAVVYHELAHLKRRDHWVCWIERLVGCLYWWHPVVWWIRRRLQEEAEFCCDAWVTALMPRGRRAYAQALLDTRQYTSVPTVIMPPSMALGLGASSRRSRRLARRITMVMTEQTKPRLSARGTTLACVVALAGVLVTPLFACPPTDKGKSKPAKAERLIEVAVPQVKVKNNQKPVRVENRPAAETSPEVTTFEQYLRDRDGGDSDELQDRIHDLEGQLKDLHHQLRDMLNERRQAPASRPQSFQNRGGTGGVYTIHVIDGDQHATYVVPKADGAYFNNNQNSNAVSSLRGGQNIFQDAAPAMAAFSGEPQDEGQQSRRAYSLDGDKLEMLTRLMARDDVPVFITPSEGEIIFHGNEAQQQIFQAFITMIDAEEQVREYRLSGGKLHDLTELMALPDVPTLIERGEDRITVHGDTLDQLIFGAFVKMISGEGAIGDARDDDNAEADWARIRGDLAELRTIEESQIRDAGGARRDQLLKRKYAEREHAYAAQMRELEQAGRQLEREMRNLERQHDRLNRDAERMEDRAESIEERAEEFEARAEALMQKAGQLDGRQRDRVIREAEEMMQRAEEMEREAEAMEAQAEELEHQAEELERAAEHIEEEAERLEEHAEEVEAQFDDDDDGDWDDDDDDDDDDDHDDHDDDDDDDDWDDESVNLIR